MKLDMSSDTVISILEEKTADKIPTQELKLFAAESASKEINKKQSASDSSKALCTPHYCPPQNNAGDAKQIHSGNKQTSFEVTVLKLLNDLQSQS